MSPSPRLQLLATAVLFSTGGAAIKSCSLSSWQVASARSGIAALTILALLPQARRRWTASTWVIGSIYAATMILFVSATKLTTAASAIYLQAAAPLYILLLGPWLLKEPVRRQDLFFMSAIAAGFCLFFVEADRAVASAPNPPLGNLLAALSGLAWSLTVVGLRWAARGGRGDASSGPGAVGPVILAGNLIAFAVCLPAAFPFGAAAPFDWLVLAYLGVFQIGIAYSLLASGIRHVPALDASLLLMLEPVLNPIWAWIIHHERPGPWSAAGGALILAAAAGKTIWDGRRAATIASVG